MLIITSRVNFYYEKKNKFLSIIKHLRTPEVLHSVKNFILFEYRIKNNSAVEINGSMIYVKQKARGKTSGCTFVDAMHQL